MLRRLHGGLRNAYSRHFELRNAWEKVGPLTQIGGSDGQDGAQAVRSQLCSFLHQEVRTATLQAEACCHKLPLGPLPRVLQHADVIRLIPGTICCSAPLTLKHDSTVTQGCNGLSSQLCIFLYMTAYTVAFSAKCAADTQVSIWPQLSETAVHRDVWAIFSSLS